MSNAEQTKANSHFLRGGIEEALSQPTSGFSATDALLLKFHGLYQQENRDTRQERKAEHQNKTHTFMIRTKVPGGRITAAQYLAHDRLASEVTHSPLRITSREGFQLHGVLKDALPVTLQAIQRVLLTTFGACGDVARNIVLCPRLGNSQLANALWQQAAQLSQYLTPRARAYAEIWLDGASVATLSTPEEESVYGHTYLPRKFKIGFATPDDNCVDVLTQDLGFVASIENNQLVGFHVFVGGGLGMTHNKPTTFPALGSPLAWIPPSHVLPLATAVVETFRDWGDRKNRKHARLKYLVTERGIPWLQAEVEKRMGDVLPSPRSIRLTHAHSHLGWQHQNDGRWSVGLYVENGRIVDTDRYALKTALRKIVGQYTPDIRLTADQNLLLVNVWEPDRAPINAILSEHGVSPVEEIASVRHRAMACPALPTCSLALSEAERVFPHLLQEFEQTLAFLGLEHEAPLIRMTGCPNGCARPYTAEIGIVGRSGDQYVLYLGGNHLGTRLGEPVATMVRRSEIVATLHPVFVAFRATRLRDEHFGDFCHRLGISHIRRLIVEHLANTSEVHKDSTLIPHSVTTAQLRSPAESGESAKERRGQNDTQPVF